MERQSTQRSMARIYLSRSTTRTHQRHRSCKALRCGVDRVPNYVFLGIHSRNRSETSAPRLPAISRSVSGALAALRANLPGVARRDIGRNRRSFVVPKVWLCGKCPFHAVMQISLVQA